MHCLKVLKEIKLINWRKSLTKHLEPELVESVKPF